MSQRIVFTTFFKNQIEAGDIGIFLEFVESLGILEPEQADADDVRKLQSKINFLIDGYNDDSRELYQIPEVRHFIQQIQAQWPYGLYFFGNEAGTLRLLIMGHVELKLEREGQSGIVSIQVPPDEVGKFMQSAVPAIIKLTARIGWTPDRAVQHLQESLSQLDDPGASGSAAEREENKRQRHTEFVESKKAQLAECARNDYAESGRGAILVTPPEAGNIGCQLIFASQQSLLNTEGFNDYHKLHQMVGSYDPEKQFVICFIESNSMDAYGINIDSPRPAAKAATTPEDISKFDKLLLPLHDQFAELGRQGYMEHGRGAVVFMLDDYDDLSPGKTAMKYFTLDHLKSVESFAGYKSLIKQVSQYDPEVFTVLCVCDPQSTRWIRLSIKPKSSPEAEPKQELTNHPARRVPAPHGQIRDATPCEIS